MAGGHYEQSLYDEFVKVLDRLDTMKKKTDQKIAVLNNEISNLKKRKQEATKGKCSSERGQYPPEKPAEPRQFQYIQATLQ